MPRGGAEDLDIKTALPQVEQPAAATTKLDITSLRNGDMVEGRYKFIERIGKGAFGTVLLMEDTVVDDRLILKFLNPNVLRRRGDDEALRARAALLAQDHAPERHPHLRLPADPGQLRHLDGVFRLAHAGRGNRQRKTG